MLFLIRTHHSKSRINGVDLVGTFRWSIDTSWPEFSFFDNYDVNIVIIRLISESFAGFEVHLCICGKEIEGVRCICGEIQGMFDHVRPPTTTVIG
jgi:hypothetical protein